MISYQRRKSGIHAVVDCCLLFYELSSLLLLSSSLSSLFVLAIVLCTTIQKMEKMLSNFCPNFLL